MIILNDIDTAGRYAEASLAPAEELRHHSYIARATWVNDAIHRLKGEWEAAKKFSGHGLATSPFDPRLLLSRILSEHEVGAFSEGDGYLQRLRAVIEEMEPGPSVEFPFCSMAIPLVARITGNNDRLEIADAAAEAVISSNSGARLWTELARIGKGMLAVQRGDAVKARENYRAFTSADTTHISTFIAFDRLLGLLAQTMGGPTPPQLTSMMPWPFAAKRATAQSWPGPAATTPTCCWSVLPMNPAGAAREPPLRTRRTGPRAWHCWKSPWQSPPSWACGL